MTIIVIAITLTPRLIPTRRQQRKNLKTHKKTKQFRDETNKQTAKHVSPSTRFKNDADDV